MTRSVFFALRLFDFIISSQSMRNSVNRPPTPDDTAEEEEEKQPTLHETINIKLIESGEKERLTELLRERLIECGWKDEMKALCRAFIKKKGRNNVTVDDLVHVITPKGRGRAVAENPFFSRSSRCLIRQSNFLNYVVVGKLKLMNGMEALFTIVLSRSLEKWRQLRFTLNICILQNEGNGISVCASGLNEGSSSYSL
ncbi:hypothetical protein NC651_003308 [Populus alba x Populus x berolinensis]|nr:hypothetical protein NC651_003308 [Populus alba x Populus x berolinensis]